MRSYTKNKRPWGALVLYLTGFETAAAPPVPNTLTKPEIAEIVLTKSEDHTDLDNFFPKFEIT